MVLFKRVFRGHDAAERAREWVIAQTVLPCMRSGYYKKDGKVWVIVGSRGAILSEPRDITGGWFSWFKSLDKVNGLKLKEE